MSALAPAPAPRFSIITCTWNSQEWLPACIQSVLQQQEVSFEYIFVDGGSHDATLAQIWEIPRPVTLIRDIRGGVSHAMNQGLQAAQGDIIAFIHADDYYLHDSVLHTVDQLFTSTQCRWLFGRTKILKNNQLNNETWRVPRYSRKQLIDGNFIPHPATFVDRELLLQVGGFDETLRYAMDYDCWLRLSEIAEPLQSDLAFAAFREHGGSLSTVNKSAAMKEDLRVRLRYSSGGMLENSLHYLRYGVRRYREGLVIADPAKAHLHA